MEMIKEAKSEGRTVIFSSHVLSEIEDTCGQVAILRRGELVHRESMENLMRQHRIRARLTGEMPEVPAELVGKLSIKRTEDSVQIETPGELAGVLKWLADAPLEDVYVQPVGLRSVYDKFHHESTIVSHTEASA